MAKPINPWDAAKKRSVIRGAYCYSAAELEPGVKFFVLMIEQLGGKTHYSCEGHPNGFYIKFSSSYELAVRIASCGFFEVMISNGATNEWQMELPSRIPFESERRRREVFRWAASAWVKKFGPLKH